MLSYWEQAETQRPYDLLVVGGGITGYTAAIEYKSYRPDMRVAVVERERVGTAASSKNAGFACVGSVTEMLSDLSSLGEERFKALIKQRWEGLRMLRMRVGDQMMDYNECGGYEVFRNYDAYQAAKAQVPMLNAILRTIIGTDVFVAQGEQPHFGFDKGTQLIENRYEGQLDPAQMMAGLRQIARTMNIETRCNAIDSLEEQTDVVLLKGEHYNLRSRHVIVAVNGLAKSLLDLDVKPARAQVLITEPILDLGWQGVFHIDAGYTYFRNVDDRVLIGGGRNLDFAGEETDKQEVTEMIQAHLERTLAEFILPGRSYIVDQRWAGTMGVGEEREPIVQRVSPRIIAAVRLGGMGVAIGSTIGSQAAHLAL